MDAGLITIAVDALQAAGGYGLGGIFVWLFYKERTYAQSCNEKILAMAIKGTEAASAQALAFTTLRDAIAELTKEVRE